MIPYDYTRYFSTQYLSYFKSHVSQRPLNSQDTLNHATLILLALRASIAKSPTVIPTSYLNALAALLALGYSLNQNCG